MSLKYFEDKKYWIQAVALAILQAACLSALLWDQRIWILLGFPFVAVFNYFFYKTMDNPYKRS
jgi:hypothetical protein